MESKTPLMVGVHVYLPMFPLHICVPSSGMTSSTVLDNMDGGDILCGSSLV